MKRHFDVIVVGAGPAGIGAALVLAQAGVDVVVFERGEHPGSKNLMGGILYHQPMEDVLPGFSEKRPPLERHIVKQGIWLLTEDSALTIGYRTEDWNEAKNSYSVLRSDFDKWFADQATEAGALIINETLIDDIIMDGKRVIGVEAAREEGQVYADVVILAEGVNNLLAQKIGLAEEIDPHDAAVTVKELIELPRDKILDRFNLQDREGVAIEMLGHATLGLVGMGFMYTNRNTISLGVGAVVAQVVQNKMNPNEMLQGMKKHPVIARYIEGGESKEYSAKLIPEGGYDAVPQVYGDGVMVCGDAAQLVNAVHREGANMALISGKLAAETAIEALEAGDVSAQRLSAYRRRLDDSFIMKDLKKYRHAITFLEGNPQFMNLYPQLASRAMTELFTVDSTPKKEKQNRIIRSIQRERPFWRIGLDMLNMWRAMG